MYIFSFILETDTGYFLYPEIKDTRPTLAESEMLLDHHQPRDLEEGWLPVSLWQYWYMHI